ncbi:hypothetical protein CAPTEDRAFT_210767 [Capitella teleta]|uniref:L-serine ammonia-lyase n=1 Tax=Capitella teleta TaxID=283909 RepID=R7U6P6_CAPTE|nr:hypothetical protein CAPTEDRAFT_210767 [Capitella teleta]|eukprot:ELU01821.1 hypothetical protein CAPTEDRAFT_210767 [Capitella teleta]
MTGHINLQTIAEAQNRIRKYVTASPMIPLHQSKGHQIFLKLENLQPVGSFKLRGACNALLSKKPEVIRDGVFTLSTGNFGHALAWIANQLNIPCHVIVPDHVPEAKMAGVRYNGGHVVRVSFEKWWRYVQNEETPELEGYYVHPDGEDEIISGNGTLGLEIMAQLPDVDAIFVPYGSGGLCAGVSIAVKAMNASVEVCACEISTAAPFEAARRNGKPTSIDFQASFVDGIGCPSVLDKIWEIVNELIDYSVTVNLEEARSATKIMAESNHVIVEGAGAVSVAAALKEDRGRKIVCVVSGGNIDHGVYADILSSNRELEH